MSFEIKKYLTAKIVLHVFSYYRNYCKDNRFINGIGIAKLEKFYEFQGFYFGFADVWIAYAVYYDAYGDIVVVVPFICLEFLVLVNYKMGAKFLPLDVGRAFVVTYWRVVFPLKFRHSISKCFRGLVRQCALFPGKDFLENICTFLGTET